MVLDPTEYSAVQKVRAGKRYPDLVNSVALKVLPKETAEAEGWPTYADMAPCAAGHVAPKFCKNSLCVDCWRQRQGRETIHPRAKNRVYKPGSGPRPAATGSPVIVAPAAPIEPRKDEQNFLTHLDTERDFDKAAAAVGWTRGLVESRASSNPVFRAALDDLCARRQIPRTLKSATTFAWSDAVERNLVRHFVDSGLLHTAREAVALSASEYFMHLESAPAFAAMIEAARPLALETLKERSLHAASSGNDRLLKILTDGAEAPESYANLSHEQINAEIVKLLQRFDAQGLIPHGPRFYIEKKTGRIVDFEDCIPADDYTPAPVANANADLIGAP